ncbi:hypothetical protein ACMD2_15523 [Ananas comosus]|uniref:Uncharacterized protein n=1 Tax=Ananas comosus TaxID=4615 RepID=A0A199VXC5_ANACO|nr:hypothetical protein ACMD2_15523 [Ananas comosus]
MLAGYGMVHLPTNAVDFSAVQGSKGSSKSFPKDETRHVSEHTILPEDQLTSWNIYGHTGSVFIPLICLNQN